MRRSDRQFLFLLGSARENGNTETLARRAAEQLSATQAEQHWLRLSELPLPTFADIRHAGDGTYPEPAGHERLLLDATLTATDLVLATPVYWYSVSTATKHYLDYWSGWMRVPGVDFKARMAGKTLWAVTTASDDDPACVEPLTGMLRHTARYLKMRWGGVLVGNGSRPGDVLTDAPALAEARSFFVPQAATVS